MTGGASYLFTLPLAKEERAREDQAIALDVAEAEAEIETAAEAGPAGARPPQPPPRGLTPRMEAFCQAYVERPVGATAAVEAGYARRSARKIASRLLRVPAVAERIGNLRRAVAQNCADERSALIAKLESVIAGAIEDRNWAAAARSVALQALLAGLAPSPGPSALALPALGQAAQTGGGQTGGGQKWTDADV